MKSRYFFPPLAAAGILRFTLTASAAELQASDGGVSDFFGNGTGLVSGMGLFGAPFDDIGTKANQGSAYVFRNVNQAAGTMTESAKLIASDGAASDYFGLSVSLSGTTGLIGAFGDTVGTKFFQGSAYVFRNLDTATGTVTQSAKLTSSDGAANDTFGCSVSLSGTIGLVGAYAADIGSKSEQGAAYVFRNLNTLTGVSTQQVKLTASDGASADLFGHAVGLSGTIGLVGSIYSDIGSKSNQGSVYVFRNLDTAAGTITQNAKLIASDGAIEDNLGYTVSLSGTTGLVAAYGDDIGSNKNQGSVYLFRNLGSATGNVTESAKLMASDGAAGEHFGLAISQSGNDAMIGKYGDGVGLDNIQGSAYLFQNLNEASGAVTESIKIQASDGMPNDFFGYSVSLEGDHFVIGAPRGNGAAANSGKVYCGSVTSLTTMDEGGSSRSIGGISFESRTDWIIGKTTDANAVTLDPGDWAKVAGTGKAVYIGKNTGSDNNLLTIAGRLTANEVHIGALTGNAGNILRLQKTSDIDAIAFIMGSENHLEIEGDFTEISSLLSYLGGTELRIWDGNNLQTVTALNHSGLIRSSFASGYTSVSSVPEPGQLALLVPAGLAAVFIRRRRFA